jgi:uncharacterized glyoxalase superfamily protein PhnB
MSSHVIPTLRYRDTRKAIDFLVEAFGFEAGNVATSNEGVIEHAELSFRDGMVMLGTIRDNEFGSLLTTVQAAGKPTQSAYVIVDDVAAHAARAEAAGAVILMPPTLQDYGATDYTCSDPEGNVWSFGDYDPWAAT